MGIKRGRKRKEDFDDKRKKRKKDEDVEGGLTFNELLLKVGDCLIFDDDNRGYVYKTLVFNEKTNSSDYHIAICNKKDKIYDILIVDRRDERYYIKECLKNKEEEFKDILKVDFRISLSDILKDFWLFYSLIMNN